jgi:biotin carboxylase
MTPTTYRAADFLAGAAAAGVEIVVGTNRAQTLAGLAPAHNLTLPFDDREEAVRRARKYAAAWPITAVLGVDDEGVLVAAAIAGALGVAHNKLAAVAATRSKVKTRVRLAETGLSSSSFLVCEDAPAPDEVEKRVGFPCVVKPASLSASRGVIRVDEAPRFQETFHRVRRIITAARREHRAGLLDERVLVEAFVPGKEVALEGLMTRGRLRPLALFDKPDPLDGPFFEETLFVTPSREPRATQAAVVETAQAAATALGLTEGPLHAEFRLNDAGVWVLELAARTIGGLCSRALRFGTGMSLEELVLRHACGLETGRAERERQASGVMMIPIPQHGILRETRGLEAVMQVAGVEEATLSVPPGQEVVPLPEGDRYLGFLFARGETPEEVEKTLRSAHHLLGFDIGPVSP